MIVDLKRFQQGITRLEVVRDKAVEENAKRLEVQEDLSELVVVYDALCGRFSMLQQLHSIVTEIMNKYRKTAIAVLEQEIQNNLELVFPDEQYKVHIDFSAKGGDPTAQLFIGQWSNEQQGYIYGSPAMVNGGLAKQLIHFGSSSSILLMRGSSQMYLDEAFNSGDSKSLEELHSLFMKLFDRGLQIIGIEHKGEVFEGLPVRKFAMLKDRYGEAFQGKIVVSEITTKGLDEWKQISGTLAEAATQLCELDMKIGQAFTKGDTATAQSELDGMMESFTAIGDKLDGMLDKAKDPGDQWESRIPLEMPEERAADTDTGTISTDLEMPSMDDIFAELMED